MASYVDEIEEEESAIEQELDLLQAIYINELEVQNDESGEPVILSLTLHPSTADNADLQYVCLTLIFTLSSQYPDEIPNIAIKNPRGISDEQLTSISTQLEQLALEQKGGAMLYELIEVAKEALTHNNTPHGQCVICLEDFQEGESFTKTACYHHYHGDCLARYIQHALENPEEKDEKPDHNQEAKEKQKQEVVCAVCREPITYDLEQLCSMSARNTPNVQYKPDHDMLQLQKKMAALYQKQKDKGGIIDVEAQSNRFLIDISVTPTLPMSSVIGSATSDDKVRRTGTDTISTEENDKQSDQTKDRRSQPRYNNSERRPADGEKKSSGSYKRSHRDTRGGRGRGNPRPASSGRYGDRQDHRSDRSNWRDDDRRQRRTRDGDGSRGSYTAKEDGDDERRQRGTRDGDGSSGSYTAKEDGDDDRRHRRTRDGDGSRGSYTAKKDGEDDRRHRRTRVGDGSSGSYTAKEDGDDDQRQRRTRDGDGSSGSYTAKEDGYGEESSRKISASNEHRGLDGGSKDDGVQLETLKESTADEIPSRNDENSDKKDGERRDAKDKDTGSRKDNEDSSIGQDRRGNRRDDRREDRNEKRRDDRYNNRRDDRNDRRNNRHDKGRDDRNESGRNNRFDKGRDNRNDDRKDDRNDRRDNIHDKGKDDRNDNRKDDRNDNRNYSKREDRTYNRSGNRNEYIRDRRSDRYYEQNERQRYANDTDGKKLEKEDVKSDEDRTHEPTKPAPRYKRSITSKDETQEKEEVLEKDEFSVRRGERDERDTPRNYPPQDRRGQNEPRRGGKPSRDFRPRNDVRQHRADNYQRTEAGSGRGKPQNDRRRNDRYVKERKPERKDYEDVTEKRSGEKSASEKPSADFKSADRIGHSDEESKSRNRGNHQPRNSNFDDAIEKNVISGSEKSTSSSKSFGSRRNYQPRNRTDARRDQQRSDRYYGNDNKKYERSSTNKNVSQKEGVQSVDDVKLSGHSQKDAAGLVRLGDGKSKPQPGFEQVSNDVKPPKVKPPPGFEDFR